MSKGHSHSLWKETKRFKQTSPERILVFCLTTAPAATMACFSTYTPSSKVAFVPINASSSMVHPCKIALWPKAQNETIVQNLKRSSHKNNAKVIHNMITHHFHSPIVTLSPMIVGKTFPPKLDFATRIRELSCILVPDPILMLLASPSHKEYRLDNGKKQEIRHKDRKHENWEISIVNCMIYTCK